MKHILDTVVASLTSSTTRTVGRALLVGAVATLFAMPVVLAEASEASAQVKVIGGGDAGARPAPSKKRSTKRATTKKRSSKKRATKGRTRTTRRVVRSRTRVVSGPTHVARVYAYNDGPSRQAGQTRTRTVTRDNALSSSAYLDFGLGVAGADTGASGTGIAAGLGMRKGNLGLGVSALGLFADSPDQVNSKGNQGLTLGGLAVDGRLYLPLSSAIEPYAMVGLGYYSIGNAEDQFRPTLDLGVGADFKVSRQLAVGGRYVYNGYVFDVPSSSNGAPNVAGDSAGDAWSAMGTVTLRF